MSKSESPNSNLKGIVTIKIFSDGKEIESIFGLISFKIRKEINKIGKALFVFEAGNMPKGETNESDSDAFKLDKTIEIKAGYGTDELSTLYKGMVITHNITIDADNEGKLEIECRDLAYLTTLQRRSRIFNDKTDTDIINTLLKEYNDIKPTVKDANLEHKELMQHYVSDWDFILARAKANGLIIITDGEKINISKPDVSASSGVTITYGTDLIEFNGKLNSDTQYEKVIVSSWNSQSQEVVTVTNKKAVVNEQGTPADKPMDGGEYTIRTSGHVDKKAMQAMADSQALQMALSRITGPCRFCGNAKVEIGKILTLKDIGKRFNGEVYIGALEHDFDEDGWVTSIEMGLNNENEVLKEKKTNPASEVFSVIEGLHIGKVCQLTDDPFSEYKIQVKLPAVYEKDNKVWARVNSFWGSNSYGAFFIPDVGDEVVVGFLNNDPCQAIILGSLYSSKQKPPQKITAENNIKTITTRSGMKLEFEEGKKIITIQTPGNNKIEINDDKKSISLNDQNKNSIIMDSNGITIESGKTLTLKAKTNIIIEAGTDMAVKSKTDLKAKGLNVEIKADAALTLKGSAKAELSASGQTVVKGAMVMIN